MNLKLWYSKQKARHLRRKWARQKPEAIAARKETRAKFKADFKRGAKSAGKSYRKWQQSPSMFGDNQSYSDFNCLKPKRGRR